MRLLTTSGPPHLRAAVSWAALLAMLLGAAGGPLTAQVRPPRCVPTHPVTEGVPASDSVRVRGRWVPRTAAAVRAAYLAGRVRLDGPPFYAGERVWVRVDGIAQGTAVYDGCQLIAETPGVRLPAGKALAALEIERAPDTAGYQTVVLRSREVGASSR